MTRPKKEECLRCGEESLLVVDVWSAELCELCGDHTGLVCFDCLDDEDALTPFQIDPRTRKYVPNKLVGESKPSPLKFDELNPPERIEKAWNEYTLRGFDVYIERKRRQNDKT